MDPPRRKKAPPPPPPQKQQAPVAQLQQGLLYTKDGAPAEYSTKWEDLHPESQNLLLQIQERILEYKEESLRIDQCSRLYESSLSSNNFQPDASQIMQELRDISTFMEIEKVSLQELLNDVNKLCRNTPIAVHAYEMLSSKFGLSNISSDSTVVPTNQNTSAMGNSGFSNQLTGSSMVPVDDFCVGIPKRPSQLMQLIVARFEEQLTRCGGLIDELEQLVEDTDKTSSSIGSSSIQSLTSAMSKVCESYDRISVKLEKLHFRVMSVKEAYLANLRRRGDWSDPFVEADSREIAEQEAAARSHQTKHSPATVRPSTHGAGLVFSSEMAVSSVALQSRGSSEPKPASGSSILRTPASAAPPSTTSFFTPPESAPLSNLFSSLGFSPQATHSGTSSPSPFGSEHNSSQIGDSSPSFGSTLAVGSSPSPPTSSSPTDQRQLKFSLPSDAGSSVSDC